MKIILKEKRRVNMRKQFVQRVAETVVSSVNLLYLEEA